MRKKVVTSSFISDVLESKLSNKVTTVTFTWKLSVKMSYSRWESL